MGDGLAPVRTRHDVLHAKAETGHLTIPSEDVGQGPDN
jgi:hypothetical protein